jgi:hypothetical protein
VTFPTTFLQPKGLSAALSHRSTPRSEKNRSNAELLAHSRSALFLEHVLPEASKIRSPLNKLENTDANLWDLTWDRSGYLSKQCQVTSHSFSVCCLPVFQPSMFRALTHRLILPLQSAKRGKTSGLLRMALAGNTATICFEQTRVAVYSRPKAWRLAYNLFQVWLLRVP